MFIGGKVETNLDQNSFGDNAVSSPLLPQFVHPRNTGKVIRDPTYEDREQGSPHFSRGEGGPLCFQQILVSPGEKRSETTDQ